MAISLNIGSEHVAVIVGYMPKQGLPLDEFENEYMIHDILVNHDKIIFLGDVNMTILMTEKIKILKIFWTDIT